MTEAAKALGKIAEYLTVTVIFSICVVKVSIIMHVEVAEQDEANLAANILTLFCKRLSSTTAGIWVGFGWMRGYNVNDTMFCSYDVLPRLMTEEGKRKVWGWGVKEGEGEMSYDLQLWCIDETNDWGGKGKGVRVGCERRWRRGDLKWQDAEWRVKTEWMRNHASSLDQYIIMRRQWK